MSFLLAAADVDPIWSFVFVVIGLVLAAFVVIQTFRATPILAAAVLSIGIGCALAFWP